MGVRGGNGWDRRTNGWSAALPAIFVVNHSFLVLPGFTGDVARQSPEVELCQMRHRRDTRTDYAALLGQERLKKYCSHPAGKKTEAVFLGFGFVSAQLQLPDSF
jgi:hypothetical protein